MTDVFILGGTDRVDRTVAVWRHERTLSERRDRPTQSPLRPRGSDGPSHYTLPGSTLDGVARSSVLPEPVNTKWRTPMPTTVNAYGAVSATDPLEPMTVERRDLGPHDVLIDTSTLV